MGNGFGLKDGGQLITTSLSATTKVNKKHQSIITYKRPLDFSPCYSQWLLSFVLATIVNIEFLCHCRVGCALRFLFFLKERKFFKNNFYFGSALQALCLSFGRSLGLCGFDNVLENSVALFCLYYGVIMALLFMVSKRMNLPLLCQNFLISVSLLIPIILLKQFVR